MTWIVIAAGFAVMSIVIALCHKPTAKRDREWEALKADYAKWDLTAIERMNRRELTGLIRRDD